MNRVSDDELDLMAEGLESGYEPVDVEMWMASELRSARKVLALWDEVNGEEMQEAIDKHNAQFPEGE